MNKTNVNTSAGSVRRNPNGKWVATIVIGYGRGARKRTATFSGQKDAKAWISEMRASGVPDGEVAELTVAQAVDAYVAANVLRPNTRRMYAGAKDKMIEEGIGSVKLAALKPSRVKTFTTWMVNQKLAASSVNSYAAKLNAVLRFTAEDGALTFTPKTSRVTATATVKKPAITAADVKALYEAAPEEFAPAIIFGAYAGMRLSEAAAVTVADIDFLAGTVTVNKAVDAAGRFVETKNSKHRKIDLPSKVLDQLSVACNGKAFDSTVATNSRGGVLSTRSFSMIFDKVATDAGVDVTSHALRKYYVTTMLTAGVPIVDVANYIGDTVKVMLETYALPHPSAAEMARNAIAAAFDEAVAA